MRNLRNIEHTALKFSREDDPLAATTWDGSSLICAFGPSSASPAITLKRFSQDAWRPEDGITITSWDAPSPNPDLAVDRILSLHCFPDSGIISLVLEGGDIIVVREDATADQELIEIVGSVDVGIAAAAWSPDEELLTIATKADTLLFMTRDYESTASIALSPDDVQISNHVSVGWGKKETQFHGPRAKAMRDPTVPEHIDQGELSDYDDESVSLTWRGDGQYLATNTIIISPEQTRRRIIRVYSREGVLDSVSEPINGLEAALSWKPSGQLISGIQRRDDRIDVVHFERNGLRHGEFSLRLTKEEMETFGSSISLNWNLDSTVLAVNLKDRIQLWTMGNYHYYLKQEILLEPSKKAVRCDWHSEKALQLACSTGRRLSMLSYSSEVTRGLLVPPDDYGVVAVIDGSRMKITPLRVANVPPPMTFDEVELPANAIDVVISGNSMRMAVLHHDRVSVWRFDYRSRPARMATLLETMHLDAPDAMVRQICFDDDDVITLASTMNAKGTQLMSITDFGTSATRAETDIPTIFKPVNRERVYFQNSKGGVHDCKTKDLVSSLPTACPQVEVWYGDQITITFGMTSSGVLHIKSDFQTLKISGCTSFAVTDTHLVYTTSSHLLKFVHLHVGELEIPPDEPEKDERCRNIERGAKLVTVMPSAYSLILQMPRGNLETIYPRALVLAGIRAAINEGNYTKAFLICRTQRVDMNILHDYAPEQFMRDAELFVKQVKKVEYIDLFLSSLSDDDVSQTIYKETIKLPPASGISNGVATSHHDLSIVAGSKVNKICDTFLRVLSGHESTYLQCIITAHVCKNPPDLAAGLTLVSNLRKQKKQDELEQAVEHICFLADVNQLYDTALGIYDLDVALLVAQQSQKDPREYLPYLQKLHDLEPLRQRFAVDNDLKRYPKALSQLDALGAFDEVKSYAAKHDLYGAAIELYRYDDARLTELMRIYAEFLGSRNRYKESGIAYEYVGDYTAAYESYRSASLWRECLACAGLMGLSDEKVRDIAQDLADGLEESKSFADAAILYHEYLQDLPAAVKFLCRASKYSDATRLIAKAHQEPLLTSVLDPSLVEASASATETLAEMRTQLQHQIPRLRDLRLSAAQDPMGFLDSGVADANAADFPDDISLAATDASTSAGTFMTRYTNRSMGTLATNATRKTSKNKRREERKRARGKKGTVYEEAYLVNSIARLMERLNETGDDVERLVEGLMRRGMRQRAVAVQSTFVEVQEACRECIGEVFQTGTKAEMKETNGADAEGYRPVGGEGVLYDAMQESRQKREAPVLKKFDALSLLESR